jgi:hypothetical protein
VPNELRRLKIMSGGQTGVDRAALDAAIALGVPYGGWCPRGGWAEDMPHPPGLLANYPLLKETPLSDPAQRTAWNVRDSDAVMILIAGVDPSVSKGTALARAAAEQHDKPLRVVDLRDRDAVPGAVEWLAARWQAFGKELKLGIGGPRESEVPGIYDRAATFLHVVFEGTEKHR